MARYIDADKMQDFVTETTDSNDWMVSQYNADWISSLIESQPTSDVVEVVRCGNCRYFYKGRMGNRCTLSLGLKTPHRNTWCCYGERKKENKDDR